MMDLEFVFYDISYPTNNKIGLSPFISRGWSKPLGSFYIVTIKLFSFFINLKTFSRQHSYDIKSCVADFMKEYVDICTQIII